MNRGNPRRDYPSAAKVPPEDLGKIIQDGDARLLVERAEEVGSALARQLTTSQIRNIFGTVRQIEMRWSPQATEADRNWAARQILLLKPKLAYQARKERGRGVDQLADILVPAIDMIGDDRERFQRFVDFFEAILAYHTASGGM
ncbi:MAG: type III-A CRISPR-associated protein Csm2 [Anaerolineae bacterium]